MSTQYLSDNEAPETPKAIRDAFNKPSFHHENAYTKQNSVLMPVVKREEPLSEREKKQDRDKYKNIEDNVHTRTFSKDPYLTVKEFLSPDSTHIKNKVSDLSNDDSIRLE